MGVTAQNSILEGRRPRAFSCDPGKIIIAASANFGRKREERAAGRLATAVMPRDG
jgi:hypothetical protein